MWVISLKKNICKVYYGIKVGFASIIILEISILHILVIWLRIWKVQDRLRGIESKYKKRINEGDMYDTRCLMEEKEIGMI